jgi:outer membrane receptor protein involved in Fe transport
LAGNDLPGAPHWVAAASAKWQVSRRFALHATARWLGREFVDEENSQTLGEALVVNGGMDYALSPRSEIFLRVSNVGDARVEVARGGDGVGYGGARRSVGGGVRISW